MSISNTKFSKQNVIVFIDNNKFLSDYLRIHYSISKLAFLVI